jgi:hypothetical protein
VEQGGLDNQEVHLIRAGSLDFARQRVEHRGVHERVQGRHLLRIAEHARSEPCTVERAGRVVGIGSEPLYQIRAQSRILHHQAPGDGISVDDAHAGLLAKARRDRGFPAADPSG